MKENQLPPSLCPSCYRQVVDRAPEIHGKQAFYCTENSALAIVIVDAGLIQRWRLIGPVADAREAQAICDLSQVVLDNLIQASAKKSH
jgi:hypothetical protein